MIIPKNLSILIVSAFSPNSRGPVSSCAAPTGEFFLSLLFFSSLCLSSYLTSVTKMSKGLTSDQVASAQLEGDYAIKSESTAPRLDTSQWPLLLKNYDKLLVRSSHFTPIPSGCSPLKRDITSYVKFVLPRQFIRVNCSSSLN